MPVSRVNQQLSLVKGIDHRLHDERLAQSQLNSQPDDQHQAFEEHLRLRLSDFEKIEKIGQGTFGKVYRAEYKDPSTGEVKLYALKKLNMLMDEMSD